jgi:hypothetical protein
MRVWEGECKKAKAMEGRKRKRNDGGEAKCSGSRSNDGIG